MTKHRVVLAVTLVAFLAATLELHAGWRLRRRAAASPAQAPQAPRVTAPTPPIPPIPVNGGWQATYEFTCPGEGGPFQDPVHTILAEGESKDEACALAQTLADEVCIHEPVNPEEPCTYTPIHQAIAAPSALPTDTNKICVARIKARFCDGPIRLNDGVAFTRHEAEQRALAALNYNIKKHGGLAWYCWYPTKCRNTD